MAVLIPAILTSSIDDFRVKTNLILPFFSEVQLDIIDGKFAPHQTISPMDLPNELPINKIELHLMVEDPLPYIENLQNPHIGSIIFHIESLKDADNIIFAIPDNVNKGIALNPETPALSILPYREKINSVLLLSVVPGAQGHQFLPEVLSKISEIRRLNPNLIIGIDGGVNIDNIHQILNVAPDRIIVGSAIWKSSDISSTINDLLQAIHSF